MAERTRAVWLAALLGCTGALAAEEGTPTAEEQERERLIDRLIRGEDVEGSISAFKALVEKRDAVRATSERAREKEQAQREERRAWHEAWAKNADSEVGWRCRLSADPAHPRPADGWAGDWGRVVKREQVRLPPKNALDEGALLTLYEVKGQKRTYHFSGERFGVLNRRELEAREGDLLLVCVGGESKDSKLPPAWQEGFVSPGFAVRLAAPPRIAQKTRFNPIHITDNDLFWAVKDVRWKYPADAYVLCVVDVEADLGGGRYAIDLGQKLSAVLEAGPKVPGRELLVPGRKAWAILGGARFDPTLKKLVLTVHDVEAHYVEEAK